LPTQTRINIIRDQGWRQRRRLWASRPQLSSGLFPVNNRRVSGRRPQVRRSQRSSGAGLDEGGAAILTDVRSRRDPVSGDLRRRLGHRFGQRL